MVSGLTAGTSLLLGDPSVDYVNTLRQTQMASGVEWDVPIPKSGDRSSPLPLDEVGARYELWTMMKSDPLKNYLLDSTYVGSMVPRARIVITTEDTGTYYTIPRTLAGRPFRVEVVVDGLLTDQGAPAVAKKLELLRHVQSYGVNGTGKDLDRSQATRISKAWLTNNRTYTLDYPQSSVPPSTSGGALTQARGEERFSVHTMEDKRQNYDVPASQLATQTIHIWPHATGTIQGISDGDILRFKVPDLTLTLENLYPESSTYLQVYKGPYSFGTVGTVVPPAYRIEHKDTVPLNATETITRSYGAVFDSDGTWTMELLTLNPFGIYVLDHVTFTVVRTMTVNGGFYTHE